VIISDVTREEGIAGNYGAWYVSTEKKQVIAVECENNGEMAIFVLRRASSYRYVSMDIRCCDLKTKSRVGMMIGDMQIEPLSSSSL
jgi:ribosomal protein L37AE/L43A